MTLTLDLPHDVQEALAQDAQNQSVTPERAALDALRRIYAPGPQNNGPQNNGPQNNDLTISERNARLIALLHSFEDGDPEEQRRELAELVQGIEEARPGQRQVFGLNTRGKTRRLSNG